MNLDTPTPASSDDDTSQDSLEDLRAKLAKQRAHQKATLAKHKRTTFLACEQAKKGTTFYDAAKIQALLDEDGEDEETEE